MYTPIRDYAIIGNLHSCALVSKYGSIDWACAPFLDSPSIFGALLDIHIGGKWEIAPTSSFTSTQEYIPNTNILVTSFSTSQGKVEVVDFIPIETKKEAELDESAFKIYRKVRCTEGTAQIKIIFSPQYNYAQGETTLDLKNGQVVVEHDKKKSVLFSDIDFISSKNGEEWVINLSEGEEKYFLFHFELTKEIFEDRKKIFRAAYEQTYKYWLEWINLCNWDLCGIAPGALRDMVIRSSLILKILFFEPTGSIAAAATTSLPEEMGGVRNWDYRFNWLRDASFTLQSLFRLGHSVEAKRYLEWILSDACGVVLTEKPDHLQIMYGLRGEHDLREEHLPHFEGYRQSKPVRIGNAAYRQKQWDIYGSILDTIWQLIELDPSYKMNETMWQVVRSIANYVVEVWEQPDEGLWEVRGGGRHFVYSKVMCFVALDRAGKIARTQNLNGEVELWEQEKEKIRSTVYERGWSKEKQAFTQSFDSEELDSAVLLLPLMGFIEGTDPRMISTIEKIEQELSTKEGLLYRYKTADGLPGEEGIFLLASFWLVDALVLSKQIERAEKLFRKLIHLANHVGLYSEEMDSRTNEFLGNFPQAYTHIGLLNSAFLLKKF